MSVRMTWRSSVVVFFLFFGVVAFPSATHLPWVTTAEARPIPPRLEISAERLSLAVTGARAADEAEDEQRLGP